MTEQQADRPPTSVAEQSRVVGYSARSDDGATLASQKSDQSPATEKASSDKASTASTASTALDAASRGERTGLAGDQNAPAADSYKPVMVVRPPDGTPERAEYERIARGQCTREEAQEYAKSHGFPEVGLPSWDDDNKVWIFPPNRAPAAHDYGPGGKQLPEVYKTTSEERWQLPRTGGDKTVSPPDVSEKAQREYDDKILKASGLSRQEILDELTMNRSDFREKYGHDFQTDKAEALPSDVFLRVAAPVIPDGHTVAIQPSGRVTTDANERAYRVAEYHPPDTALGGFVRGAALWAGASPEKAENYEHLAEGIGLVVGIGIAAKGHSDRLAQEAQPRRVLPETPPPPAEVRPPATVVTEGPPPPPVATEGPPPPEVTEGPPPPPEVPAGPPKPSIPRGMSRGETEDEPRSREHYYRSDDTYSTIRKQPGIDFVMGGNRSIEQTVDPKTHAAQVTHVVEGGVWINSKVVRGPAEEGIRREVNRGINQFSAPLAAGESFTRKQMSDGTWEASSCRNPDKALIPIEVAGFNAMTPQEQQRLQAVAEKTLDTSAAPFGKTSAEGKLNGVPIEVRVVNNAPELPKNPNAPGSSTR